MKCQKCGKNEVNFHYSSNVNGCVTETYLCSECATESGYDLGGMFSGGSVFDEFLPFFGAQNRFLPVAVPLLGANAFFPAIIQTGESPVSQLRTGNNGCGCEKHAMDNSNVEVDDEMQKRREINVIREQMRLAAQSDDFERAIELRERIKEMES